jgi:hypothetical protein
MATWRPTVVDGGLAPPRVCPRCGRPCRARRAWKAVVVDRLEDLAVLVCAAWLAGIAAAGVQVLRGPPVGLGGLLVDVVVLTLAGVGLLGLIVRVGRMVTARAARGEETA